MKEKKKNAAADFHIILKSLNIWIKDHVLTKKILKEGLNVIIFITNTDLFYILWSKETFPVRIYQIVLYPLLKSSNFWIIWNRNPRYLLQMLD